MSEKKKLTVVELFAGAGGLALGLEKADFKKTLITDNDAHSINTLKLNRPNWNIENKDVQLFSKEGIKKYLNSSEEVTLLSGGYPCQSFSYAGRKLGLEDVRGTLFYDFAKILSEIKPKMFLAENVKGLVSHDGGKTLKIMIKVFENAGYNVVYQVLNSWDYNVAQKRMRVFIIGVRNDIHKKIGSDFVFPKPSNKKPVLKDVLKNVPESPHSPYNEKKINIFKLVPAGGCWRDLPEEIAKEYMGKSYYLGGGKTGIARKLSWNEPSLTILCSPAQKQTERCHPDEIRPLTIRESARIQGFPDNWKFTGSVSQQYKQIGNAVPINLAYAVGKQIKKYLLKLK
ncbi:MAG: DNA (cytosine-5-)-methyltransferase [Candidatus Moranbacteria bacterium]|nr:DNA (cytosine-5-)-methyltransferase [Candidatus Moranbacteria bacterium]